MSRDAGPGFGPYEIVGFPGAGGMVEVFEAVDARLDRRVVTSGTDLQLAGDFHRADQQENVA